MASTVSGRGRGEYCRWESLQHRIFREELEYIRRRRRTMVSGRKEEESLSSFPRSPGEQWNVGEILPTTETNFLGLSLSGGGIRSATFNLGFLQALYNCNILKRVDYLSTVSGGGYIGSCLTALLNTSVDESYKPTASFLWDEKNFPFARPDLGKEAETDEDTPPAAKKVSAEKASVRHLRYYSNYLTPTGTLVDRFLVPMVIIARGLFYNFMMILPVIMLLAAFLAAIYIKAPTMFAGRQVLLNIDAFTEALAKSRERSEKLEYFILEHTAKMEGVEKEERVLMVRQNQDLQQRYADLVRGSRLAEREVLNHLWAILRIPAFLFLVMTVCAFFYFFVFRLDQAGSKTRKNVGIGTLWGLLAPFGRRSELGSRRRFNRFFGYVALGGITFFVVELFGAVLVFWEHYAIPNRIAFVSFLTFLAPKLLESRGSSARENKWMKIVGALLLFTLTPLILLWVTGLCINLLRGQPDILFDAYQLTNSLLLGAAGFVLLYVANFVFNINKISLHSFYRDRLCGAYIIQGDTRDPEEGGVFNSIRQKDDLRLSTLYDAPYSVGPYHIINANLNLKKVLPKDDPEGGGILRKGESFIFSKYWCGSEKTGYRRTSSYEMADPHLDLGSAMAISGAAVNIGMGEGDMPAVRLLMGLLNIRLGYWAPHPNPANTRESSWHGKTVPAALCAMREWIGNYPRDCKFINLTDGGHFDNIGVYELLRRRCKYIIVADAEADPKMSFQALSYLLRLARIDFGVKITIDIDGIIPDPAKGHSAQHCAVGIIHYPKTKRQPEETGYLLYCKSSLSGDEPAHLYEYHAKHRDFPHETTADQWFNEQQFETYRELGYHIGKKVFVSIDGGADSTPLEELFVGLKEFWYPQSHANRQYFTRHTSELNAIFEKIRTSSDLQFMDFQIFPEWAELTGQERGGDDRGFLLPTDEESIRAGFYISCEMIQLMENVYTDLGLEGQYGHPDNRGWMNLFSLWSKAGIVRVTWAVAGCTYGAKFQKFCERKLDLNESEVVVTPVGTIEGKTGVAEDWAGDTLSSLNGNEQQVIQEYFAAHPDAKASVFTFQLKVAHPDNTENIIRYHFGFAIVSYRERSGKPILQVEYFGIRDHLQRMGLGRKAIKRLAEASLEIFNPEYDQHGLFSLSNLQFLEGMRVNGDSSDPFLKRFAGEVKKVDRMLESVCVEIERAIMGDASGASNT